MKKVRAAHRARREDIGDLTTYQALPVRTLQFDAFEPFLFLNHHGPQTYPPGNRGLPFGPHPHRGFETVTFILDGDLVHKDTGGAVSRIRAGGVQWMTAGRGLIHAELSSDEFKASGGDLEILQLWLNLPARLKMTEPKYVGLQNDQVPKISLDHNRVTVDLYSGDWEGTEGAIRPITDVHLARVTFSKGGSVRRRVAPGRAVFFYVVRGRVMVNGESVEARHLVELSADGEAIDCEALEDSVILFGHAAPNNEPVVPHGPFVMNTEAEIVQAVRDYQAGRFGDPAALN